MAKFAGEQGLNHMRAGREGAVAGRSVVRIKKGAGIQPGHLLPTRCCRHSSQQACLQK